MSTLASLTSHSLTSTDVNKVLGADQAQYLSPKNNPIFYGSIIIDTSNPILNNSNQGILLPSDSTIMFDSGNGYEEQTISTTEFVITNFTQTKLLRTNQKITTFNGSVDFTKNIIFYSKNGKVTLPVASTMSGKTITIKNNYKEIININTMTFNNSLGGPTNRTIERKYMCPLFTSFLLSGSIILVGINNTPMVITNVIDNELIVSTEKPEDVNIGDTITPGIPISLYCTNSETIDGNIYDYIPVNTCKNLYSDGLNWYTL